MIYDRNRSGFLDVNELANFFNELFQMYNDPRRFNQQQAMNVFKSVDSNYDGKIEKR